MFREFRHSFFLLFLLTLSPAQLSLAETMKLEIIPLNNRLVEDIIPIVRPLVVPGGSVTGMNNQLIIKTTPANLADIKQVLGSIDRAPRRLMITVKQNVGGSQTLNETAVTGKYSTGSNRSSNAQISTGPDHSDEGVSVTVGDQNSHLRYRALEKYSNIDDKNTYKVQALEGRPAYINQGQSVPVNARNTVITENGVVIRESTGYHNVNSGFYVVPRLNGDQVTLLASTELSRVESGRRPSSRVQGVETTVTGKLGQWMELGGIDQSYSQDGRQTFSSSKSRGQEFRTVLIKVDEIK